MPVGGQGRDLLLFDKFFLIIHEIPNGVEITI